VKTQKIIRAGGLEIDPQHYSVTYNQVEIKLTQNEFKLLNSLAGQPGQTLTREQLLDNLHGIANSADRSVDSHIKNLRKKLLAATGRSMIQTIYGVGYRLQE